MFFPKHKKHPLFKSIALTIIFSFLFETIFTPQIQAQMTPTVLNLPVPGQMIGITPQVAPPVIRGVVTHPENPLEFDFVIDHGDQNVFSDEQLRSEAKKLVKYFLASLTVPEEELWVNLSPYEPDQIIPKSFGDTEMGRDVLAQDYLLKQLTASLMYPENETGKALWDRIYTRLENKFGTRDLPVDTFNKVWIVPEKVVIFEHNGGAYVANLQLDVMLEEDYVALSRNALNNNDAVFTGVDTSKQSDFSEETKEIIRSVLLPEIKHEVNFGQTFAPLRQIAHSLVLAGWYKQNLRNTLLSQVYVNQSKTKGIDTDDKQINEKIYKQYLDAFDKGVFDFIKEEYDPATQSVIPKKYFSGGVEFDLAMTSEDVEVISDPALLAVESVQTLVSNGRPTTVTRVSLLEADQNTVAFVQGDGLVSVDGWDDQALKGLIETQSQNLPRIPSSYGVASTIVSDPLHFAQGSQRGLSFADAVAQIVVSNAPNTGGVLDNYLTAVALTAGSFETIFEVVNSDAAMAAGRREVDNFFRNTSYSHRNYYLRSLWFIILATTVGLGGWFSSYGPSQFPISDDPKADPYERSEYIQFGKLDETTGVNQKDFQNIQSVLDALLLRLAAEADIQGAPDQTVVHDALRHLRLQDINDYAPSDDVLTAMSDIATDTRYLPAHQESVWSLLTFVHSRIDKQGYGDELFSQTIQQKFSSPLADETKREFIELLQQEMQSPIPFDDLKNIQSVDDLLGIPWVQAAVRAIDEDSEIYKELETILWKKMGGTAVEYSPGIVKRLFSNQTFLFTLAVLMGLMAYTWFERSNRPEDGRARLSPEAKILNTALTTLFLGALLFGGSGIIRNFPPSDVLSPLQEEIGHFTRLSDGTVLPPQEEVQPPDVIYTAQDVQKKFATGTHNILLAEWLNIFIHSLETPSEVSPQSQANSIRYLKQWFLHKDMPQEDLAKIWNYLIGDNSNPLIQERVKSYLQTSVQGLISSTNLSEIQSKDVSVQKALLVGLTFDLVREGYRKQTLSSQSRQYVPRLLSAMDINSDDIESLISLLALPQDAQEADIYSLDVKRLKESSRQSANNNGFDNASGLLEEMKQVIVDGSSTLILIVRNASQGDVQTGGDKYLHLLEDSWSEEGVSFLEVPDTIRSQTLVNAFVSQQGNQNINPTILATLANPDVLIYVVEGTQESLSQRASQLRDRTGTEVFMLPSRLSQIQYIQALKILDVLADEAMLAETKEVIKFISLPLIAGAEKGLDLLARAAGIWDPRVSQWLNAKAARSDRLAEEERLSRKIGNETRQGENRVSRTMGFLFFVTTISLFASSIPVFLDDQDLARGLASPADLYEVIINPEAARLFSEEPFRPLIEARMAVDPVGAAEEMRQLESLKDVARANELVFFSDIRVANPAQAQKVQQQAFLALLKYLDLAQKYHKTGQWPYAERLQSFDQFLRDYPELVSSRSAERIQDIFEKAMEEFSSDDKATTFGNFIVPNASDDEVDAFVQMWTDSSAQRSEEFAQFALLSIKQLRQQISELENQIQNNVTLDTQAFEERLRNLKEDLKRLENNRLIVASIAQDEVVGKDPLAQSLLEGLDLGGLNIWHWLAMAAGLGFLLRKGFGLTARSTSASVDILLGIDPNASADQLPYEVLEELVDADEAMLSTEEKMSTSEAFLDILAEMSEAPTLDAFNRLESFFVARIRSGALTLNKLQEIYPRVFARRAGYFDVFHKIFSSDKVKAIFEGDKRSLVDSVRHDAEQIYSLQWLLPIYTQVFLPLENNTQFDFSDPRMLMMSHVAARALADTQLDQAHDILASIKDVRIPDNLHEIIQSWPEVSEFNFSRSETHPVTGNEVQTRYFNYRWFESFDRGDASGFSLGRFIKRSIGQLRQWRAIQKQNFDSRTMGLWRIREVERISRENESIRFRKTSIERDEERVQEVHRTDLLRVYRDNKSDAVVSLLMFVNSALRRHKLANLQGQGTINQKVGNDREIVEFIDGIPSEDFYGVVWSQSEGERGSRGRAVYYQRTSSRGEPYQIKSPQAGVMMAEDRVRFQVEGGSGDEWTIIVDHDREKLEQMTEPEEGDIPQKRLGDPLPSHVRAGIKAREGSLSVRVQALSVDPRPKFYAVIFTKLLDKWVKGRIVEYRKFDPSVRQNTPDYIRRTEEDIFEEMSTLLQVGVESGKKDRRSEKRPGDWLVSVNRPTETSGVIPTPRRISNPKSGSGVFGTSVKLNISLGRDVASAEVELIPVSVFNTVAIEAREQAADIAHQIAQAFIAGEIARGKVSIQEVYGDAAMLSKKTLGFVLACLSAGCAAVTPQEVMRQEHQVQGDIATGFLTRASQRRLTDQEMLVLLKNVSGEIKEALEIGTEQGQLEALDGVFVMVRAGMSAGPQSAKFVNEWITQNESVLEQGDKDKLDNLLWRSWVDLLRHDNPVISQGIAAIRLAQSKADGDNIKTVLEGIVTDLDESTQVKAKVIRVLGMRKQGLAVIRNVVEGNLDRNDIMFEAAIDALWMMSHKSFIVQDGDLEYISEYLRTFGIIPLDGFRRFQWSLQKAGGDFDRYEVEYGGPGWGVNYQKNFTGPNAGQWFRVEESSNLRFESDVVGTLLDAFSRPFNAQALDLLSEVASSARYSANQRNAAIRRLGRLSDSDQALEVLFDRLGDISLANSQTAFETIVDALRINLREREQAEIVRDQLRRANILDDAWDRQNPDFMARLFSSSWDLVLDAFARQSNGRLLGNINVDLMRGLTSAGVALDEYSQGENLFLAGAEAAIEGEGGHLLFHVFEEVPDGYTIPFDILFSRWFAGKEEQRRLRQAVTSRDITHINRYYAALFAFLGTKKNTGVLADMLGSDDYITRALAAEGLHRLGYDFDVSGAAARLDSRNNTTVSSAIFYLGSAATEQAIDILETYVLDETHPQFLRKEAIQTLARVAKLEPYADQLELSAEELTGIIENTNVIKLAAINSLIAVGSQLGAAQDNQIKQELTLEVYIQLGRLLQVVQEPEHIETLEEGYNNLASLVAFIQSPIISSRDRLELYDRQIVFDGWTPNDGDIYAVISAFEQDANSSDAYAARRQIIYIYALGRMGLQAEAGSIERDLIVQALDKYSQSEISPELGTVFLEARLAAREALILIGQEELINDLGEQTTELIEIDDQTTRAIALWQNRQFVDEQGRVQSFDRIIERFKQQALTTQDYVSIERLAQSGELLAARIEAIELLSVLPRQRAADALLMILSDGNDLASGYAAIAAATILQRRWSNELAEALNLQLRADLPQTVAQGLRAVLSLTQPIAEELQALELGQTRLDQTGSSLLLEGSVEARRQLFDLSVIFRSNVQDLIELESVGDPTIRQMAITVAEHLELGGRELDPRSRLSDDRDLQLDPELRRNLEFLARSSLQVSRMHDVIAALLGGMPEDQEQAGQLVVDIDNANNRIVATRAIELMPQTAVEATNSLFESLRLEDNAIVFELKVDVLLKRGITTSELRDLFLSDTFSPEFSLFGLSILLSKDSTLENDFNIFTKALSGIQISNDPWMIALSLDILDQLNLEANSDLARALTDDLQQQVSIILTDPQYRQGIYISDKKPNVVPSEALIEALTGLSLSILSDSDSTDRYQIVLDTIIFGIAAQLDIPGKILPSAQALEAVLRDSDPRVRELMAAALRLSENQGREVIDIVASTLNAEDQQGQSFDEKMEVILDGEHDIFTVRAQLGAFLQGDSDVVSVEESIKAAQWLGKLVSDGRLGTDDPFVTDYLLSAIVNPDAHPDTRVAALNSLRRISFEGDREDLNALPRSVLANIEFVLDNLEQFMQPNKDNRRPVDVIFDSLTGVNLAQIIGSDYQTTASVVASGLSSWLGLQKYFPVSNDEIVNVLNSSDVNSRRKIADALAMIPQTREVVGLLQESLSQNEGRERSFDEKMQAIVFGEGDSEIKRDTLIKLIQESSTVANEFKRRAAAEWIGRLIQRGLIRSDDPVAFTALFDVVSDNNQPITVRSKALNALLQFNFGNARGGNLDRLSVETKQKIVRFVTIELSNPEIIDGNRLVFPQMVVMQALLPFSLPQSSPQVAPSEVTYNHAILQLRTRFGLIDSEAERYALQNSAIVLMGNERSAEERALGAETLGDMTEALAVNIDKPFVKRELMRRLSEETDLDVRQQLRRTMSLNFYRLQDVQEWSAHQIRGNDANFVAYLDNIIDVFGDLQNDDEGFVVADFIGMDVLADEQGIAHWPSSLANWLGNFLLSDTKQTSSPQHRQNILTRAQTTLRSAEVSTKLNEYYQVIVVEIQRIDQMLLDSLNLPTSSQRLFWSQRKAQLESLKQQLSVSIQNVKKKTVIGEFSIEHALELLEEGQSVLEDGRSVKSELEQIARKIDPQVDNPRQPEQKLRAVDHLWDFVQEFDSIPVNARASRLREILQRMNGQVDLPDNSSDSDQAMFNELKTSLDVRRKSSLSTDEPKTKGGVNLNPKLFNWQIKRDSKGVPLPMPEQPMNLNMEIEGFVPVIRFWTPVNMPKLLGLDLENDNFKMAAMVNEQ